MMTIDDLVNKVNALKPIDGVTLQFEAEKNILTIIDVLLAHLKEQDARITELESKDKATHAPPWAY